MRKSFAEYAEAAKRPPFEFPMPEGGPVMVAQPTLDSEHAAFAAANEAGAAGGTYADALLAWLSAYVSDADGQRIADAYRPLPAAVLAAVVADMREHFGVPAKTGS